MSASKNRQPVNPSQAGAPDTIDPESLPPPMRRAWERYREPDAGRHLPKGDGAHLYARVSDEEQAGPGRTSIDEQIRLEEKALVGTDIPIVGRWRDEGFSGVSRLGDRPVGRELLAEVKAGQIVVVFHLDRLSRNTELGLADINELRQRGVGLLIAADHRWIPPAGSKLDPIDEFNPLQGIVLAQFERDLLVARTEAGRRALVQRGYWPWAVAPYGYKREHDGFAWKLVLDDNEQKVLALMRRSARRLRASGYRSVERCRVPQSSRREVRIFRRLCTNAEIRHRRTQDQAPGWVKSDRAKPRGNPTIGADSSSGVAAVLQQKIRDAERVLPIIAHLVSHKGCSSYRQVADALNYLEVETPRNKGWHPTSVKNAMATTAPPICCLCVIGAQPPMISPACCASAAQASGRSSVGILVGRSTTRRWSSRCSLATPLAKGRERLLVVSVSRSDRYVG